MEAINDGDFEYGIVSMSDMLYFVVLVQPSGRPHSTCICPATSPRAVFLAGISWRLMDGFSTSSYVEFPTFAKEVS